MESFLFNLEVSTIAFFNDESVDGMVSERVTFEEINGGACNPLAVNCNTTMNKLIQVKDAQAIFTLILLRLSMLRDSKNSR